MMPLQKGQLLCRFARGPDDVRAAQRLRQLCFLGRQGGHDQDDFDPRCQHVLIEERGEAGPVGCFRLLPLAGAGQVEQSYSARYYDLSALGCYSGGCLELGRFCIRPGRADPDILRLAWAAVTRVVDDLGVGLLFGCASFAGVEPGRYDDAFAYLAARHLAPAWAAPGPRARIIDRYADRLAGHHSDPEAALRQMPSLLRGYLAMGGWVSDHAVVDAELNTLHVFTGLEVSAIPAARVRRLRAVAG